MNKTARLTVFILAASAFSFAAGAGASGVIQKVEAYLRPDYTVKVNGKQYALSNPPIIYRDKSFVPLADIGDMLDIDVKFDQKTKTIYVNGVIPHQPLPGQASGLEQEEFAFNYAQGFPVGYLFTYLGGEYPVLSYTDYTKNAEYYRLADIERMGLDTNGLRKAREKYTGGLYIRKDEVDKLWMEKPSVASATSPLVVGESDQNKINALLGLQDSLNVYSTVPQFVQMIVIDKVSAQNEYKILAFTNGYLTEYDVTLDLTKSFLPDGSTEEKWFFKKSSSHLLQLSNDADQTIPFYPY